VCLTGVAWTRGAREQISPHPSLSKRGIRRTWMDVISGAYPGLCSSFLTPHSTKFATDLSSLTFHSSFCGATSLVNVAKNKVPYGLAHQWVFCVKNQAWIEEFVLTAYKSIFSREEIETDDDGGQLRTWSTLCIQGQCQALV